MKIETSSIVRIIEQLNHGSDGVSYFLPRIQRPFVWNEEQIYKLFDSIMRDYPISTLLIWKTKEDVKHRKFIDDYKKDIQLSTYHGSPGGSGNAKVMVLDGQQRLQSLFIGLRGSYGEQERELYFNILTGKDFVSPEDTKYSFKFIKEHNDECKWPWVRFKDLIKRLGANNSSYNRIAKELLTKNPTKLTDEEDELLIENLERIKNQFFNKSLVNLEVLDAIEDPISYKMDDVAEIFIRANSGGTKLNKSDLLFSLLASNWEEVDCEMDDLLENLNRGGFCFDRDFILKSYLTLLGKGARYEVEKFRDESTLRSIRDKWEKLANPIRATHDFLLSMHIRSDKAMPSYLATIPLIYFSYRYPEKFSSRSSEMEAYLLRSLLAGAFNGSPDTLIDKIIKGIDDSEDFLFNDICQIIRNSGRSLEITPDVIFKQKYGAPMLHLLFNIWYKKFNYSPLLKDSAPQIDHIFPQSLLCNVKDQKGGMRYKKESRDQIANCMLLTTKENGGSGKRNTPPEEWFAKSRFQSSSEHKEYLEMHLIPNKPALWKLDKYDEFIEERKKMIAEKFSTLTSNNLHATKKREAKKL